MLKIMVVDDNVDAADSLAELLCDESYDAQAVYTGRAAVDLADQFLPNVIFMDITMPVMDGNEAARLIRRNPRHVNLRLVALTGYGAPSDIRAAAMAGFDHYLLKPTAFSDILLYVQHMQLPPRV
jgi:CheY-like chemotaxis protein